MKEDPEACPQESARRCRWLSVPEGRDLTVQEEFTRKTADQVHGGYFIRVVPGVRITEPVQSCLFMKADHIGQSVHSLIIAGKNAEVHIITGCATARPVRHGMPFGISEVSVRKGGKLTHTMINNWGMLWTQ